MTDPIAVAAAAFAAEEAAGGSDTSAPSNQAENVCLSSGGVGYVVRVAVLCAALITVATVAGIGLVLWVVEHPASWGAGVVYGVAFSGLLARVSRGIQRLPGPR